MPTHDPSANDGPPKSDEFEMQLEPVDPAELNLKEIPTVEAVSLRRPGFAFWKAPLWCLLFLALTQVLPGIFVVGPLILIELPKIDQRLRDEDAKKDSEGGTTKPTLNQILNSPEVQRTIQIATLVTPVCGIVFSLFFLPRVVGRDWRHRLSVRIPHIEHVVLIVLLAFPLLIFNMALEGLMNKLTGGSDLFGTSEMKAVMESMTTWPWWVLFLGISVGPAISEELFCRGFLGQGLVSRYGIWTGVLATSFLFGIIHLNPLQGIVAFLIGIVLHFVYIASRTILIPILLHFLNNFIAISADARDLSLPIGASLEHALQYQPALMILASAFLAGTIGLAFYQSRVRIWNPQGLSPLKSSYPHVEMPHESSPNRAAAGTISILSVGLLIVSASLFSAAWFGL